MSPARLCFVAALALRLPAAEPWILPLFTSDPRAILSAVSRYPVPEGLNAITIDYAVQVQIDDTGKMTTTTRSITRVLRLQGIQGARPVAVPWVDWRENRPKLKARVITSDGQAHLLEEASVSDVPAPAGHVRLVAAILPAVDVDSVLELETVQSDREAGFPGARLGEIVPDTPFFIGHFQVTISAPSNSPVRAAARGFANPPHIGNQASGKGQAVFIEASNVFAAVGAGALPPEMTARPTITFSNVASWQSVAAWYAPVIQDAVGAPLSGHATPSADPVNATEAMFEELRKKVHDDGTPFGGSPYRPHTPPETLKKGSGDSKDEAVVLISELAASGITAKVALVSADPRADAISNLPGLEAFNRVLVYVPGQHPLWIDPAAEFTPVSRLPLADEGRWALIVDAGTTDLIRTPENTASENRQTETVEIRLKEGGSAAVVETIGSSGVFEDVLRPLAKALNSADADERENARTRMARFAGAQQMTKAEAPDPSKLLSPARVQLTLEGYSASQVGDQGGFVDLPGPVSANFQHLAAVLGIMNERGAPPSSSRSFDYYVPPSFVEESTYHVIPPPGYRFEKAPPPDAVTVGPLQLATVTKLDADGSLWITYTGVNPKLRYTAQEVAAMRRDAPKLSGKQGVRVVFYNVAEEKLANGEIKEAITLLRQNVASAPASPAARLRLASAYLDAGARAEAVKLCREVLAKDPNNAAAYEHLGWIYTHDEFGAPFSAGMNMSEAEKAYLKALDLNATPGYLLRLATLYTYNSAGVRFGNSARVDDAVRLYGQAGLDTLARAGMIDDYATTLLFARKYSELRQFFLYPQADHANPVIKLAGIAAGSRVNDVKEEAEYIFPDAAKRKVVLIEAARLLLSSREFAAAAALFDLAGAVGHGISAEDLARVRKARDFDESAQSKQPGIAAFQRFVVAVLNGPDADAWKKTVITEARDSSLAQVRFRLLELFGKQDAVPQALSWPSLADMFATASDFSAEGDEQSGFRIRAQEPGRKTAPKTVGYVVKRGKEFLVLGLTGDAARSGEALAKARSGDLASARQWLDWAKDEPMPDAFRRLVTAKSDTEPELVLAAAAALGTRGASWEEGVKALNEAREKVRDPEVQTDVDAVLEQGLLEHDQYADAIPVLQRLQSKWPNSTMVSYDLARALLLTNRFSEASTLIDGLDRPGPGSLTGMRLREQLLAQQGKFQEAAAQEAQICANAKPSAFDWNDLAWVDLFATANGKATLEAAEKAAELAQGNPAVLHTLALAQASTGHLKEARANAYVLMDGRGSPDEVLTIFGRIAEQLELPDVASRYYGRVNKPESNWALSSYAFAQMRLKELAPRASK